MAFCFCDCGYTPASSIDDKYSINLLNMDNEDIFEYCNTLLEESSNISNSPEVTSDDDDDYLSDIDDFYKNEYKSNNTNNNNTANILDSENFENDIISKMYEIPPKSSPDARNIWKMAKIPIKANSSIVEKHLFNWVIKYTRYYIKDNGEIIKLCWKSKSGTSYECSFTTFVKWMLCASQTHLSH